MEITNNEVENNQENAITEEVVAAEPPKLYAGKYKSVDELEKAYKNSAKVFNENKNLQEKLKNYVEIQEQQQQYQNQLEERKKILGDQLKVIEDYVAKTYPAALQNTILNTLLGDENAMNEAMKHRDQTLNSQVPGLSSQRANLSDPYEGRTELVNMAHEYQKNPTEKNRKRYINLANAVAEARKK